MKVWLLMGCAALGGCNLLHTGVGPGAGADAPRTVQVNGRPFVFTQITASTWTASAPGQPGPLPVALEATDALRQAIESLSGCRVTDSDYSRQGRQFDAQVDCDSTLR